MAGAIKEDPIVTGIICYCPPKRIFYDLLHQGIPHIILVGPDGKILAKEMRHEELTDVPANFIK